TAGRALDAETDIGDADELTRAEGGLGGGVGSRRGRGGRRRHARSRRIGGDAVGYVGIGCGRWPFGLRPGGPSTWIELAEDFGAGMEPLGELFVEALVAELLHLGLVGRLLGHGGELELPPALGN